MDTIDPTRSDIITTTHEHHDTDTAVVSATVSDTNQHPNNGTINTPIQKSNTKNDNVSSSSSSSSSSSLANTYGKRISRFLLLSQFCNVAFLLYAHIGLSAVIVSNVERVRDIESNNNNNSNTNDNDDFMNNNNNQTEDGGACTNENDMNRWYMNNGSMNKPIESSYCAKQYYSTTSGCLLNQECYIDCFITIWNYTKPCATCFSDVPICSFQSGCASVCQDNNGLSNDCMVCTYECNVKFLNCTGLTFVNDTTTTTTNNNNTNTDSNNSDMTNMTARSSSNEEICMEQQYNINYENVTQYYVVYELKFFSAIERAWTSNAELLAIIVIVFSGLWPYIKNITMLYLWKYPITTNIPPNSNNDRMIQQLQQRHFIITWLKRLGKWSFVDVYIIIILLVGITIEINVSNGSVPLILKGEPRPAIISFLIATIWSFIHLEVIYEYHIHQYHTLTRSIPDEEHRVPSSTSTNPNSTEQYTNMIDAVQFHTNTKSSCCCCVVRDRGTTSHINEHIENGEATVTNHNDHIISIKNNTIWKFRYPYMTRMVLVLLLTSTVLLFIFGSIYDVVHFISFIPTNSDSISDMEPGCIYAYNIYTLGTRMVSKIFLYDNSALGGVYILFIIYMLFGITFHLVVHCIQLTTLLFNIPLHHQLMCRMADIFWTFASVEVILLGIFSVQYKFEELVASLAGSDGAQFFGMKAELQDGFFILIGYSIVGGICQYIYQCTVIEYYHIHPFQKLSSMWIQFPWCNQLLMNVDDAVATG